MNVTVSITPEQLRALRNVICMAGEHITPGTYMDSERDMAHRTCASMAHDIYVAWSQLPDGSALKSMYADDVWHPETELPA